MCGGMELGPTEVKLHDTALAEVLCGPEPGSEEEKIDIGQASSYDHFQHFTLGRPLELEPDVSSGKSILS